MRTWPTKDPDEVLDYGFEWLDWLDGDTIVGSVWEVQTGITVDRDDYSPDKTTIWLSGGVNGQRYVFTNRITTAAGRVAEQMASLPVG